MLLIVGIGSDLLSSFYAKMGKNLLNYEELAVMLIFTIAFFVLISRLPPLLSGIVTGSSIGSTAGIGSYSPGGMMVGAGAAMGTAAAVATYGGSLAVSKLAAGSVGAEALRSAIEKGQAQDAMAGHGPRSTGDMPSPFASQNPTSPGERK
jgi:type IV secretion system protein TrbL